MKKVLFFFGTLTALWFITTCEKNDAKPSDEGYLIFGHFYGYCVGEECVEIFKLERDKVLEDSLDRYPSFKEFYSGEYDAKDKSDFEKVKGLQVYFPMELLKEEERIIGSPDAGDWGGYYIEIKTNNDHQYWIIDQMRENVPEYLHKFMGKVDESIRELKS